MKSLAFDRAVSYYDRTRALPREVADTLTDALIEIGELLPARRCLDVGTGTGRIALPLVARGVSLVGVDLSFAMLARLASKWPLATLAQADAARLPLPDRSFDVALMSHVLHVIGDWQQALFEVRRVVRPEGALLHVWNQHQPDSVAGQIKDRFRAIVEARGESVAHPGGRREECLAFWQENGWSCETSEIAHWQDELSPASQIQELRERIWSGTWQLSEESLRAAVDELTRWAEDEMGPLERTYLSEHCVMIDEIRFSG